MGAIPNNLRAKPAPMAVVYADGAQATALAQFAQALVHTLMEGVRDAANLNIATVHALLAPVDRGGQIDMSRVIESWRFSWRTYEISATTAANVMRLAEAHTRKGLDALWKTFEHATGGEAAFDATDVDRLRAAFDGLRTTQLAAFDAAIEAHRCLITLAAEAR